MSYFVFTNNACITSHPDTSIILRDEIGCTTTIIQCACRLPSQQPIIGCNAYSSHTAEAKSANDDWVRVCKCEEKERKRGKQSSCRHPLSVANSALVHLSTRSPHKTGLNQAAGKMGPHSILCTTATLRLCPSTNSSLCVSLLQSFIHAGRFTLSRYSHHTQEGHIERNTLNCLLISICCICQEQHISQ